MPSATVTATAGAAAVVVVGKGIVVVVKVQVVGIVVAVSVITVVVIIIMKVTAIVTAVVEAIRYCQGPFVASAVIALVVLCSCYYRTLNNCYSRGSTYTPYG